ncbi:hypothetical protein [Actinokineospora diospyrosa]|uniref:hypothetical protein n=1 Tax=Actinokineospora diospyrosa TaxID=103728 RepID=UPI0020A3574F|nr:hypothetical protein [Actinokineospora diospyrosa]
MGTTTPSATNCFTAVCGGGTGTVVGPAFSSGGARSTKTAPTSTAKPAAIAAIRRTRFGGTGAGMGSG